MAVLLNKILLKYPVEEMYGEHKFRIFSIPFVNKVSSEGNLYSELFQYSDSKKKYKINDQEYSYNDQNIEKLIDQKFNQLQENNDLSVQHENIYKHFNNLTQKIEFSDFKNCQELNLLQAELEDPTRLEHFTDWIIDYANSTGLWQQRFPKRSYNIICLVEEIVELIDTKEVYTKKIFSFSNLDDPLKIKRYFLINGIYYLTNNQTYKDRIEIDSSFDDIEVYYLDDEKDDNPLNDDYFNEWYDILVLDLDKK